MRSITRRSRATENEGQAATVDKLIEAFERLLSQGESFTTISVEQLSREAGIVRATFYLHFRNKGELVQHLMKTVEKELRAAAAQSLSKTESFGRTEFKAFMRQAVDIHFLHRAAIRAMVEVSSYDSEVARVYQEFMARQASDTRVVIEKLRVQGRAHPAATPDLAEILAWAAERSITQVLRDDDLGPRRHEIADMLTHVVWSSIALPPATPR